MSYSSAMSTSAQLPKGDYYIGDICYALNEDVYQNFWGQENKFKSGKFTTPSGDIFAVSKTAVGDGSYEGSNDFSYFVDAGVIGIVSKNLVTRRSASKNGTMHYFAEDIIFTELEGTFTVTGLASGKLYIRIDTRCNDSDCSDSSDSDDSDMEIE